MRRAFLCLMCLLLILPVSGLATSFSDLGSDQLITAKDQWGPINAHDPSIVRDGDMWYVFGTDASIGDMHDCGIQVRSSSNLIDWDYLGTAFADYAADCAAAIDAVRLNPDKHEGLWAPDVVKVGDKWRMYYSASTFSSSRSAIGLAESDSVTGPYVDKGIVVKSDANAVNGPNAIDPCIFTDVDGKQYMTYGSFFGGIFLTELDEDGFATGKPVKIAGYRGCRAEGSYLTYLPETGYYYLFLSYGSLSSDYNLRVGRSEAIDGPYLDASGNQLTNLVATNEARIGVKLMGGYQLRHDPGAGFSKGIKAPGHCSVYADGDMLLLCHHARTATLPDYWFGMQIRQMFVNRHGWPVVAPMSYAGETLEAVEALPEGAYNLIVHGTESNADPIASVRVKLADGQIEGRGAYEIYDGYRVSLTLDDVAYDGVCLWQQDDERNGWTMSLTAMSEDGLCVWLSEEALHPEKGA